MPHQRSEKSILLAPPDSEDDASSALPLSSYTESEESSLMITTTRQPDSEEYNASDESGEENQGFPIIPKSRLTVCQLLIINLPWFGLSLLYLLLTIEVVPSQVEAMVGPNIKGTVLGLMISIGAVLTLFISPLIGLKCDRMNTRMGRRRPVMIISAVLLCVGLMGMALSTANISVKGNSTELECVEDVVEHRCRNYINTSHVHLAAPHVKTAADGQAHLSQTETVGIPLFKYFKSSHVSGDMGAYIVCYLIAVLCFAGITVPYNALIADRTHPDQRGMSSGVMGGMVLLGNIGGASLALFIVDLGLYAIYGIISGIVLISITITTVTIGEDTEHSTNNEPLSFRLLAKAFAEPFRDPNFRWLFFTRFMMQQGVSTIFTFIQFWVDDMVLVPHCWPTEKAVAVLMSPLVGAAAICSVLFGVLSDRIKRRKPLVIVAAIMMSITAGLFPVVQGGKDSYIIALILLFFSGVGYGTYLSVDFALLLDVLPLNSDRAKDIAVWNQALILPQILSTPTGGFVLDFFEQFNCQIGLGYIILFSLTCVYFFISAVFVVKIKIQ